MLFHYPSAQITSYPGDSDSFMHLHIPVVKDKIQINGGVFQEFYSLIEGRNYER